MGCLGIGLAALLVLAVPASVAHTSLVGAYVVIVLLAAAAVAALVITERRRMALAPDVTSRLSAGLTRVALLAAGYAVIVTVIHATR